MEAGLKGDVSQLSICVRITEILGSGGLTFNDCMWNV